MQFNNNEASPAIDHGEDITQMRSSAHFSNERRVSDGRRADSPTLPRQFIEDQELTTFDNHTHHSRSSPSHFSLGTVADESSNQPSRPYSHAPISPTARDSLLRPSPGFEAIVGDDEDNLQTQPFCGTQAGCIALPSRNTWANLSDGSCASLSEDCGDRTTATQGTQAGIASQGLTYEASGASARSSQESAIQARAHAPKRVSKLYTLALASISAFTVSSIMNAAAKAAGIVDRPDPQADPYRDVEANPNVRLSENNNQSRVSLPLSHQRSFSMASSRRGRGNSVNSRAPSFANYGRPSAQYSEAGEGQIDGEEEPDGEEIPWGRDHPCYPHLNPHVPQESPVWEKTRVIRIKRDWMIAGDLAPTFSSLYPEILDPVVPEDRFRDIISHVNKTLTRIYDPYRPTAWMDVGMGLLSGWLWDDLGLTRTKRELRGLDEWMERWNKQFGEGEGVRLIPLRRTAYLCLDIQIPDPELGPDVAESEVGDYDGRRSYDSRRLNSMGASSQRPSGPGRAESNYSTHNNDSATRPEVPTIPGKYLQEAQQQVERHVQGQR